MCLHVLVGFCPVQPIRVEDLPPVPLLLSDEGATAGEGNLDQPAVEDESDDDTCCGGRFDVWGKRAARLVAEKRARQEREQAAEAEREAQDAAWFDEEAETLDTPEQPTTVPVTRIGLSNDLYRIPKRPKTVSPATVDSILNRTAITFHKFLHTRK